jgi:tetratricopeptide (TPR) repeat protein
MSNFQDRRVLARLLLVAILMPLLGISAGSHDVRRELSNAQQSLTHNFFRTASDQIASAAHMLPARADLWETAGRYALQSGDAQAALQDFETAAQTGLSPQGLLDYGDAYQQTGDLPAAVRVWTAAEAAGALRAPLFQRLWQAQLKLGDIPAAIQSLQSLITLQPADAQLSYRLGLLLATQHPDDALAPLALAAQLDPSLSQSVDKLQRNIAAAQREDDPAYSLLAAGRTLAALNEWGLATVAFQQAVHARPDYAEAWAFLGEARQHLPPDEAADSSEDGLADLQKAVELDPKSLSATTFLAIYWKRHQEYDRALEVLQSAIKLAPQNPALQVELGDTLANSGDLDQALQAYLQAADLVPQDITYLQTLADFSLKYEYQLHEVALFAARRAVNLDPHSPAALDLMGQVLIKLNDLENAERFLQRALQADENYAPTHMHLGVIYMLDGDTTRAYQELNLAQSLDPDGPVANQSERLLKSYFP